MQDNVSEAGAAFGRARIYRDLLKTFACKHPAVACLNRGASLHPRRFWAVQKDFHRFLNGIRSSRSRRRMTAIQVLVKCASLGRHSWDASIFGY